MSTDLLQPGGGLTKSKLALADATASDVLYGKKFYAGDKLIKAGTMVNRGAWGASISGNTVTIPQGYHDGSGKVTATLRKSSTSFNPNVSMSGSRSFNVVNTFGIPLAVAKTLNNNCFSAAITRFDWKYSGSISGIPCDTSVSYNANTTTLTVSYSSIYVEFVITNVVVYAFWIG